MDELYVAVKLVAPVVPPFRLSVTEYVFGGAVPLITKFPVTCAAAIEIAPLELLYVKFENEDPPLVMVIEVGREYPVLAVKVPLYAVLWVALVGLTVVFAGAVTAYDCAESVVNESTLPLVFPTNAL